jgi:hypothetical protein
MSSVSGLPTKETAAVGQAMATDHVRAMADRLGVKSNWGRLSPDDQRGMPNLVTSESVSRAAATVCDDAQIGLGCELNVSDSPYYPQALDVALKHEMITA